jgi:hypothetical protein
MSKPSLSGLTLFPAAWVSPPELDPARIGRCEHPHFPWNDWERWAVACGLGTDLARLGGLLIREAYNHGWSEPLCVWAGWGDDGREMQGGNGVKHRHSTVCWLNPRAAGAPGRSR